MSGFEFRHKTWEVNGKKFTTPSIFSRIDTNEEYTIFTDLINKFGIDHIAGYTVNMNRLPYVFPDMPTDRKQRLLTEFQRKDNRILIIDPILDKLLSASTQELMHYHKLKDLFPKSKGVFNKLDKINWYMKKRHKLKNELKKQKKNKIKKENIKLKIELINNKIKENKISEKDINMGFYEELFKLQDRYSADILTIPSIPISYNTDINFCLKTTIGAINLANSLYPEKKKMLILYLKKNALFCGVKIQPEELEKDEKSKNSDRFSSIPKKYIDIILKEKLPKREEIWGSKLRLNDFSNLDVDYFGIKVIDFQLEPINEIVLVYFTSSLRDLIDEKYMHFFDMDETFYALFSRGGDSYSCPISSRPFYGHSTVIRPDGKWYHPVDKEFYYYDDHALNLKDMQKEDENKIPCPCGLCDVYGTFTKIEELAKESTLKNDKKDEDEIEKLYKWEFAKLWNTFRRKHWLCYKDLELEELQRDDPRLAKEVIARSKRQDLHIFFE
ncbi:MAG: hypothetical protein ACFE95_18265 [Candidatus Hodarchaeota archaeon]